MTNESKPTNQWPVFTEVDLKKMGDAFTKVYRAYHATTAREKYKLLMECFADEGFWLGNVTENLDEREVRQAKENDLRTEGYEAGFLAGIENNDADIQARINAAVLAEREACARICDDVDDHSLVAGQAIRSRRQLNIEHKPPNPRPIACPLPEPPKMPSSATQADHIADGPYNVLAWRLYKAAYKRFTGSGLTGRDWNDVASEAVLWAQEVIEKGAGK